MQPVVDEVPGIPMQRHSSLRNSGKKAASPTSMQSSDSLEMEMEYDPNACADTDTYFFAVIKIFILFKLACLCMYDIRFSIYQIV